MSDNKKYYYLKLKENFFDSDEMIILENMQDGYLYSNILLKLYLKSLKNEGRLMFKDVIPYTPQVLATIVRHPVGVVEKALAVFQQIGLIEILETGAIYMLDIQNFIGKSTTEADRIRDYRKRIEQEKESIAIEADVTNVKTNVVTNDVTNVQQNYTRDRDRDRDRENSPDPTGQGATAHLSVPYQEIMRLYNETCLSYPRCRTMSEARKKAIRARFNAGYTLDDFKELFEKAEKSSFLRGSNGNNWSANLDWLIKDANMAKVLDGNYDDKKNEVNYYDVEDDIEYPF